MHRRAHNVAALALVIACLQTLSQGFTSSNYRSYSTSRQRLSHPSASSPISYRRHSYNKISPLTTKDNSNDEPKIGVFRKAKQKFDARPGTYLTIPIIAALVGWFTNWLAVQMIFYPIQFRGIPLWIRPEIPLGAFGWQGIIPCKTKTMSISLVEMVTSQLLTVSEVFGRLNPRTMAKLLAPRVPLMGFEIMSDIAPTSWLAKPGIKAFWCGLSKSQQSILSYFNVGFLTNMIKDMQLNIDSIFSLESCVVSQMLLDRAKLGELFRKCGQKELDFLTNSGLWFGFLLGLIQMAVALVWENPWTLSIGGGIVGLLTNWLALKWIFEPVNPTKIGPWVLQGKFLRRQTEVAAEFSKYFAEKILTSSKLWGSMLSDPATTPAFHGLFGSHFGKFLTRVSRGLFRGTPEPAALGLVTSKAIEKLPGHVHVLHEYMDKTLGLEDTIRRRMELMTSAQFERVLHPIFEQDELTLILAGAALGFAAGLVQQGLETGAIKLSNPLPRIRRVVKKGISKMNNIRLRLLNRNNDLGMSEEER